MTLSRLASLALVVLAVPVVGAAQSPAPAVEVARVERSPGGASGVLRGELKPWQDVALHARVEGFVERVLVDRGSAVTSGQLLAVLSAPEIDARLAELTATREAAEARLAEARARLTGIEATERRLMDAAKTPGVISGQELQQSQEATRAARAAVAASEGAVSAANAAVEAARRTRGYLEIRAPFAGVVTERVAHPGALAGPSRGPALRLAQVDRLRLVVAVPEARVSSVVRGQAVTFASAAFPGESFTATVARDARALDPASRTLAVEADVVNRDGRLSPGLYADVTWPGATGTGQWRVPATAVVRTTARVFVIRVSSGVARWVDVRVVSRQGEHAEVVGPLQAGDTVVRRATDELRDGTTVTAK